MKNKEKLFIITPILIAPLLIQAWYTGSVHVNSNLLGGYSSNYRSDEKFNVHIETDCTSSYGLNYTIYNAKTGQELKSSTTTKKKGNTRDIEMTIPFSLGFEDGFEIYGIIKTTSNLTLWENSWYLYPNDMSSGSGEVHLVEENNRKFSFNPTYMQIKDIPLMFGSAFDFTETSTYFLADEYYRLDIENIKFTTNDNDNFTYENCYLVIDDNQKAFPYLERKDDGLIYINLAIKKSTNDYLFFVMNEAFFCSEETLEISTYPLIGFMYTEDFFLPKNKRNEIQQDKFFILIENAGPTKESFMIPIDYITDLNLIGDRGDSKYYLKGGVVN